MSDITEASVRASAVEYMRRQLRQAKSLSKSLLAAVNFEKGEIIALTSTLLSPEDTVRFHWGGHTPQADAKRERIKIGDRSYVAVPKASANKQLVEAIYESLQNPESICLLENYLAEAHPGYKAQSRG